MCWHPWLWWKINDVKWGEVTNSDQRFSCLKISGLLSKENRFEPCSGVRFDSGFASASSSELRMQQLAFKLKPLLVPRVILVEANCSSIRCVLGLTLWCFFPRVTSENVAEKFGVSRKKQDVFALASQQK